MCRGQSRGQGALRKDIVFSPRCWTCTEESQDSRRGNWGRRVARCQAKQGFCSSGTGVSPLDKQSRGRVSVPQTCTRGPGGSEVSLPAWLPGKLRYSAYLTPPSQLSAEEEERKRERLVPQFTRVVGAFTWWHVPPWGLWAPDTPLQTGDMRTRDMDPNLGFQSPRWLCRDRKATSDIITYSQEGRVSYRVTVWHCKVDSLKKVSEA